MTKIYRINTAKAISETLDGETIIINLETGCYYSINPAGSQIWNTLIEGINLDTSSPNILTFLEQLTQEGLLIETNSEKIPVTTINPIEVPVFTKYTDMQEMLLADPVHDVDTAGWPNLKQN